MADQPMFRLIGRLGERELFVVAGLFTVVVARADARVGLSRAGRSSPGDARRIAYRHELESDVEPSGRFAVIFFLSVG